MLKIPFFSWLRYIRASSQVRKGFTALCLAVLMALAADSNLAATGSGLVGYWPFEDGSGDTAADFSGNENTGTLVNGPIWEFGKLGYGLSFDGIDDYVAVPHTDSLNISKELTVSAWVSNRATGDNLLGDPEYHVIASKGWAPDQGGSWTLAWEKKTNSIAFFVRRSSDKAFSQVFFDYPGLAHDWHHITAVVNSGKLSLYVDGLLVAGPVSLGGGSSMNINLEEVRIGAAFSNPSNSIKSWDGSIDEVQMYDRALTDAEVKALFDAAQSQPTSDPAVKESDGLTVESSTTTKSKPGRGNIQVETPVISPNGGPFSDPVLVMLSTATPGATIYYTTDKTIPTQKSNQYKDPFVIAEDTTIRAKAFKQNSPASEEATASFSFVVADFDFVLSNEGDKSTSKGSSAQNAISAVLKSGKSQPISFSVSGLPAGAKAAFSEVSCDPTCSSTLTISTDSSTPAGIYPITATGSGGGQSKSTSFDLTVSETTSFDFSVNTEGNKSVIAGSSVTNKVNVTLVSGSTQAVSFDVSGLPAGTSGSFSPGGCSPDCSSTLNIITDSSTAAGNYTVTVTASGGGLKKNASFDLAVSLPTVATPTITPNGGTYSGSVSVTLETATTGASIYYTTDGSPPTQSSTLYSGAIKLISSAIVKAKAFKSGHNASAEANASFTVTQPFDFSISNGGDKTVNAGSSVTNSISVSLTSGTTQPVTFAVSGLPGSTTYSFSAGSCSPTCSSTLTINTASSTPTGTSKITVVASGGGVTQSTSFSLTVNQPTITSCPTGQFLAEYYNNMTLTGTPVFTACQSNINYDWGTGGPGNGVGTDKFSIRWTGNFDFNAGVYNFTARADDGIRVWVGGTQIINAWMDQAATTYEASRTLTKGTHTVKVEYYENAGEAVAQVGWQLAPPRLTVTWQDNSDNEDRFEIERKSGTGGTYSQIAIVPANSMSHVDSTVSSGSTYCYRVRAGNSYGVSDYSNEACQTVP